MLNLNTVKPEQTFWTGNQSGAFNHFQPYYGPSSTSSLPDVVAQALAATSGSGAPSTGSAPSWSLPSAAAGPVPYNLPMTPPAYGVSGPSAPQMAPSIARLDALANAGLPGACQTTSCLLDAAMAFEPSMMAGARLWSLPKATRGQGDVPPVMQLHAGGLPTTTFVNYGPLESAVSGRSRIPDPTVRIGSDTFIDDGPAGFRPASTWGIIAAPIQPSQFLQAQSAGLAGCRGGEMPIVRTPYPTNRVTGLSLPPISDNCFEEQKARLNYMLDRVAESKLAAHGWKLRA